MGVAVSSREENDAVSMLNEVKINWNGLEKTSIETLRKTFLQRAGYLNEEENNYWLTVEEKLYDILLDSLSWNFNLIKYRWMEKHSEVSWG